MQLKASEVLGTEAPGVGLGPRSREGRGGLP